MLRTSSLDTQIPMEDIEVVGSLLVDDRPLIQLATIGGGATAGPQEPMYAVRIPSHGTRDGLRWVALGRLSLEATALPAVLLAGVSVLAMKYVHDAAVQIGDPVLVFGASPWSLLLLDWARLQGASPLVFAASGSTRLAECGASAADTVLTDPTPGDLSRAVTATHRAAGFAVVLDAVATQQSITHALPALRDGGRYVLAGLDPASSVALNSYPDLHRRDLELVSPLPSIDDSEFDRLFRFALERADQNRIGSSELLDPRLGWRAVRHQ